MSKKRPYCLTIGGFDPSGGAGIVADCKTFEQFKVHGLSVLTANTLQTEDQFQEIHWIDEDIILAQIELLKNRYSISFVKIGLLPTASLLEKILTLFSQQRCTIVWDPVLSATSGGEWDLTRFQSFQPQFELIDLIITPNLPEMEILQLSTDSSFYSLYLKGGHAEKVGQDKYYWQGKTYPFSPKVKTDWKKHGTGCIFASGLLSNLAIGKKRIHACLEAKRYVENCLVSNPTLLSYHRT